MIVKGVVIDKGTQETIPAANVFISDKDGNITKAAQGTSADLDGKFSIDVPQGAYLTVSVVGFGKQTIQPTTGDVKIELASQATSLKEFVVMGTRMVKKNKKWIIITGIALVSIPLAIIAYKKLKK